ncbi:hypothetical protein B0J13DRAFT_579350 [Dactylonectria estremocensis]|uniref:Uncharacterized protein n=1 Tax=Dactylonectria estremocensis TaxID=1079267 RepID=A0A9P9I6M9_9HYPO|nr:hypothetical protein B0J13DRAFT_579350 [Dactylonectria estremocensis]
MFSSLFLTLGRFRIRARYLYLVLIQSPLLKPNLAHPKLAALQQLGLCSIPPLRNSGGLMCLLQNLQLLQDHQSPLQYP